MDFVDDATEVIVLVPAPDGFEGETITVSKFEAVSGATIAIVLAAIEIGAFIRGLFGDGHAGSCGAFRDAYFETVNDVSPGLAAFNDAARVLVDADTVDGASPTLLVSTYLDLIVGIDEEIDNGFDEYKGRNLLGQTMYHDRFNGWLQRNYVAPLVFFTNDWAWKWTHKAYFERQNLFGWVDSLQQCCLYNQNRISDLFLKVEPIVQMQLDLTQAKQELTGVREQSIPFILDQLNTLEAYTRGGLSDRVFDSVTRIDNLINQSLPEIGNRIALTEGRITQVESTYATTQTLTNLAHNLQGQLTANKIKAAADDETLKALLRKEREDRRVIDRQRVTDFVKALQTSIASARAFTQQVREAAIDARTALKTLLRTEFAAADAALGTTLRKEREAGRVIDRQRVTDFVKTLQTAITAARTSASAANATLATTLRAEREAKRKIDRQRVSDFVQSLQTSIANVRTFAGQVEAGAATARANLELRLQKQIDEFADFEIADIEADIAANEQAIQQAVQQSQAADTKHQAAIDKISQIDIPALRTQLELQITGLQNTLEIVQRDLRNGLELLNDQVTDDILPSLSGLQGQITDITRLITNTIIPSILSGTQGLAELDNQTQNEIVPQINDNTGDIETLGDIIADNLDPRITRTETCCESNTNLINHIFQTELVNIRNIITNLPQTTITYILANCQQLRQCIIDNLSTDPIGLCAWGRKIWGTIAECWLNANTPVKQTTLTIAWQDYHPLGAAWFVGSAFDPEENPRGWRIVQDVAHAISLLEDPDLPRIPPIVEFVGRPTHIYTQVQG